jgi:hypothetical protein
MRIKSVLLALLLAGCASRPESIAPAYVSPVVYQSWSCQQLGEEEARVNAAYTVAAGSQNRARSNDTTGVLLLGLPLGSMTGEGVEAQVASLKGQQAAIQQSEAMKNCAHP